MTCECILTRPITTHEGQTIKPGTKCRLVSGSDEEGFYYTLSIDGVKIYEGPDAPGHVPGGPTQFLGMIGDQLL